MLKLALFVLGGLLLCASVRAADSVGPPIQTAPASFRVLLDTTVGPVIIEVTRAQAPNGADKFYSMVVSKVLDGERFFRVLPGIIVQFGIPADPAVDKIWRGQFPDDKAHANNSNKWATVSFAHSASLNSRTSQLFINMDNNPELDRSGFVPIGKVVRGMTAMRNVYSDYGEAPNQGKMEKEGNAYLDKNYPRLDYIKTATIVAMP